MDVFVKYSYDVMDQLTEAADGERQECGILRIRCGRLAGTGNGLGRERPVIHMTRRARW